MDVPSSLGYVGLWHRLSVWFSLYPDCHRSAGSSFSDSLKFFPSVPTDFPGCGNLSFLSTTPPWGVDLVLLALLLLLPSFIHLNQLCVALYGLFWWSRSPASSVQPMFCENFCICRGIPDASWREMHSISTHSPTILESPNKQFLNG